jgi:hypothetical protein
MKPADVTRVLLKSDWHIDIFDPYSLKSATAIQNRGNNVFSLET